MRTNPHCLDDSCDLDHCPKCGRHVGGYLESFQQCDSCDLEEQHQNSTNFYCEIHPKENTVRIYRGPKTLVGFVTESKESGEPYLSAMGDQTNGIVHLTLNEIEIIMDNWNQMQEMRREGVEA